MDIKRIGRFIRSMKFAVILLVILLLACAGGSFIEQGQTYAQYEAEYSRTAAGLIMALGLDDVFHSVWFVILTVLLCVNLISCNLVRFPALAKRWRAYNPQEKLGKKSSVAVRISCANQKEERAAEDHIKMIFQKLGFRKIQTIRKEAGRAEHYAVKNRIGIWGAWITHLGVLVLVIGFGAGQSLSTSYTVYGVPGQTKQIGETGYILTIDDFRVDLREDDTVEQYTADLTVSSTQSGERSTMTVSVNHPASAFGMKFYQNSMGWAATMHVMQGDEEVQTTDLCQGEGASIEAVEGLTIYLAGFYPDYVLGEDGMPATASNDPTNPGYLYRAVYNGQTQQMNVLYGDASTNEIEVNEEYVIYFDDPRYYTLIQVKKDPFAIAALAGGLLIMLGLLISFYMQTQEIWTQTDETGITVYAASRKGGALFNERFMEAAKQAGVLQTNIMGEDTREQ